MAITKNAGRQELVVASVDYTFADLVSGVAVPAINLPDNAKVLGVIIRLVQLLIHGNF